MAIDLDPNIWELKGSCYVMREEIAVEYRKACDVQLDLWLKGVSVHTKPPEGVEDECCHDFSCCYPELLLPLAERQAYVQKRRSKTH